MESALERTAPAPSIDTTPPSTIRRGYRLRAYPTKAQAQVLSQWMGCRRWTYNWGLETRRAAYEHAGETLTSVDLCESVSGWYDDKPWLEAVPTSVLQQGLRDLDAAYRRWWDGHARAPVFARRGAGDSARVTIDARHPTKVALWGAGVCVLPSVGIIRVRGRAWPPGAVPKMVTVSRSACGRWWVSFSLDETIAWESAPRWACAMDLGSSRWVSLDDGSWFLPPKALARFAERLKKLQKRLARQTKGSGRWKRTKQRIARLWSRIVDCRRDWVHKMSRWLVDTFELLGMESLNVAGMTRSARGTVEAPGSNVRAKSGLNRVVLDACLGMLAECVQYKAAWAGRTLVRVDTWFASSKLCSTCGAKNHKLKLSQRTWQCPGCGAVHDRDTNAAINIRNEMFRLLGWPESAASAASHRVRSAPAGRRILHASGCDVRSVSVNAQWTPG